MLLCSCFLVLIKLIFSVNSQQQCLYIYFECDSGECITFLYACDGIPQCDDGSDELVCQGDCDVILTEPEGFFQSPYYPRNYVNDVTCTTQIKAPENQVIYLTIWDFDLQYDGSVIGQCPNNKDTLRIYDGLDNSSSLIGAFCGSLIDKNYQSSGPYLYVVFKTNSIVRSKGFNASYYFDVRKDTLSPTADNTLNRTSKEDKDVIIGATVGVTVFVVVFCVSLLYFKFRKKSNADIQSDTENQLSAIDNDNDYDIDFGVSDNNAFEGDDETTHDDDDNDDEYDDDEYDDDEYDDDDVPNNISADVNYSIPTLLDHVDREINNDEGEHERADETTTSSEETIRQRERGENVADVEMVYHNSAFQTDDQITNNAGSYDDLRKVVISEPDEPMTSFTETLTEVGNSENTEQHDVRKNDLTKEIHETRDIRDQAATGGSDTTYETVIRGQKSAGLSNA
ncbi:uncharacterized protein [Amphiura filiformis]|uniref:uncharacterized protein isoform X2 n=1 Tax=Amphiura filiformis TaxID=82378 RepID=UPI003B20C387